MGITPHLLADYQIEIARRAQDEVDTIIGLIVVVVIGAVVFALIRYAVKSGVQQARPPIFLPPPSPPPPIPLPPLIALPDDGPGKFRVSGVDLETRMDCTAYYDADGDANARVKGELDGMAVTRVERV